jgi:hypothetical protein
LYIIMLSFIFVIFFVLWVGANMYTCLFYRLFIPVLPLQLENQLSRRVDIHFTTGFICRHIWRVCPKPEPVFQASYVFKNLRFEIRGDRSFCLLWWNCWSASLNLSLHKQQSTIYMIYSQPQQHDLLIEPQDSHTLIYRQQPIDINVINDIWFHTCFNTYFSISLLLRKQQFRFFFARKETSKHILIL